MYRILSNSGIVYTFDATTEGSISFKGRTTDKPLQSGAIVADHYVQLPTEISISGILSDVSVLHGDRSKTSADLINELNNIKLNKETFIVEVVKDAISADNCVFEELRIDNDSRHGMYTFQDGSEIYAFRISCTIKQIKKGSRGRVVAEPDVEDNVSSKKKGPGTNLEIDETKKGEVKRKSSEFFDRGVELGGRATS